MTPIRSAEALAQLFDDFAWFHDACCLSLSPPPRGADTPERVELVIHDMGVGGYSAGDLRTYQVIRLTATGVREWSFSGEAFRYEADHWMQGAEPIEAAAGFGFTLDLPTDVRLVADVFEYERLPDFTEPLSAWTSGSSVYITAPGAELPSPAQWVEALARQGAQVAWRMLGGPAHPAEQVPPDYGGWFLERPSRLTEHDYGVFVRHIGVGADGVSAGIDRYGDDDELWQAVCRSLARMFPNGVFYSGNCQLTAEEWLALMAPEADGE